MTLAERALYHQVHPLKVFTDVATALIAIDLFWQRFLAPGLVIGLLPPILVSAALIREVDLEPYRRSAMGAYLRRFMPPWLQALRLFGIGVAFLAAWEHAPALVLAGLGLIAASWATGVVRRAAARL